MIKKGQTATEYLIILAVIIIIALIVVGVLGGIPGIGKTGSTRTSQSYWSSQDVAINSYTLGVTAANNRLNLRNNLRNSLTLNSIRMDSTVNPPTTVVLSNNLTTLTSGQEKLFIVSAPGGACTSSGDKYSYYTSIEYRDSVTGQNLTLIGDVKLEGTCAA